MRLTLAEARTLAAYLLSSSRPQVFASALCRLAARTATMWSGPSESGPDVRRLLSRPGVAAPDVSCRIPFEAARTPPGTAARAQSSRLLAGTASVSQTPLALRWNTCPSVAIAAASMVRITTRPARRAPTRWAVSVSAER